MYSYVDLYFSPDAMTPLEVAERLKRAADVTYIVGPHDLCFSWRTVEEFRDRMHRIHAALKGTGVSYRVESVEEHPAFLEPETWPPAIVLDPPPNPAFNGRNRT
jgi:hypothetical protein